MRMSDTGAPYVAPWNHTEECEHDPSLGCKHCCSCVECGADRALDVSEGIA